MARVSVGATETKSSPAGLLTRRLPHVGVGGAAGVTLGVALSPGSDRKTIRKSTSCTCLDIVLRGPVRCCRVDVRHFDYCLLGKQLQTSSEANICTL